MTADERLPRIVVGDVDDDRMHRAVARVVADVTAVPVLVDPEPATPIPDGAEVVRSNDRRWRDRCVEHYRSVHRDLAERDAREAVEADPLLFAALYTSIGAADCGIAGNLSASPRVIRSAFRGLGLASPGGLMAGSFLMEHGRRRMTYADVSVTPAPDSRQLALIAEIAADAHRALTGEEPVVAMLSFSTKGSAEHADVDKVRSATELVTSRRPDLCVDGELQFDVAVDPAVAHQKAPESPVGGRANVLVFPDLDAGNIAYKASQRLAGATAIGSFVLGLAKPWIDLSRGCSEDDIVAAFDALAASCREPQPA